jgi:hypothetical protein
LSYRRKMIERVFLGLFAGDEVASQCMHAARDLGS